MVEEKSEESKKVKKKKTLIGCGVLVVIIIILILAVSISTCQGGSEDPYADDIAAVKDSITANVAQAYEAGPLQGGTAILVNDFAAYWVKDGVVYAANGVARMWSPAIPVAPTGIDIDSVEEAVN